MASSSDIAALLSSISAGGVGFAQQSPGAREQLLALTYKLTTELETPGEFIQRVGWAEPARSACLQIAVDLKIFDSLVENDSAGVSCSDIAMGTGADYALIARTMKHLAAMHIVAENDVDSYTSTPLCKALTEPRFRDGLIYTYHVAGPSFHKIPAYLKETNYQNPRNIADGPFQFGHDTKVPFWVYLGDHPELLQCFNNYMAGYRQGKKSWVEPGFYPVDLRLGKEFKTHADAVLLVDVGGGLGHDLKDFKANYPHLPGKLVLQERQEVISQIKELSSGIEASVHDFFTPQPIKGAKAYYLHSVLHDWDDDTCRKILTPLVSALEKGYSKILINELVVPNVSASWPITSMDWLMLALGAVRERTEEDWRRLLASVGLKITQIWTVEPGTESIIEAEFHEGGGKTG